MEDIVEMKGAYEQFLHEDWEAMEEYFEKHKDDVLRPMTVALDTAIHLAVYSKETKLLCSLLKKVPEDPAEDDRHKIANIYGSTALHEVAASGNKDAVKLMIKHKPKLVEKLLVMRNDQGETPLFRAAAYGRGGIVLLLAALVEGREKLPEVHRFAGKKRGISEKDTPSDHDKEEKTTSILHVAVQGQHFKTALLLLKLDNTLANERDYKGRTALHLLAKKSSSFESGYPMTAFKKLIYRCLPVSIDFDLENVESQTEMGNNFSRAPLTSETDVENGQSRNVPITDQDHFEALWKTLDYLKGNANAGLLPVIGRILKEKRKHKLALILAKYLIKKDKSWVPNSYTRAVEEKEKEIEVSTSSREGVVEKDSKNPNSLKIPLFVATEEGTSEIVKEILNVYAQAVEHIGHNKENILHLAVKHRRREIFNILKKLRIPLKRIVRGTDQDGFTILHHASNLYTGGIRVGPAFRLQEELKWFKRVEKVIPPYYTTLLDLKNQKTAFELFEENHKGQLEKAQQWIKDTSQSCSTVAVLIAAAVFAAAYQIPGGSNNGIPTFYNSPIFTFFTVTDILSLATSLTSVVMFLSILTSPFELEDFHRSLPRKLWFGFIMLFISIAASMLSFSATILLVIRLQKKWTSVTYALAFFPVPIFALMQFPVIHSLGKAFNIIKWPYKFVRRLFIRDKSIVMS